MLQLSNHIYPLMFSRVLCIAVLLGVLFAVALMVLVAGAGA